MRAALVRSPAARRARRGRVGRLLVLGASALLAACSTLSTWLPSWLTTPPSFSWFHSGPSFGPLPAY